MHEVCGRFVLECRMVRDMADGTRVHHGWSVFLGALLEVLVSNFGLSVPYPQTVRALLADSPPDAFHIA
jgi:hypothetical protein